MIELCCEYLSVRGIWLYVFVMSHTRFRVTPHSIISVKVTFQNENGKTTSDGICFFIFSIHGWFSFFFIAFNTGSWWRIILGGRWISKFSTVFEKYSWKIFTLFHLIRLSHFQLTLFSRLLTFYQLGMVWLFSRIAFCLLHV